MDRLLGVLARRTEPLRVWYRFLFPLSVVIVVGHRANLRRNNLADTETDPPEREAPKDFDIMGWRTADGSFNDLGKPWMGSAGTRFGRNLPLAETFGESGDELMTPSPRLISKELMARKEFVPVPHLNVLAAAWIQFMVHDWLSHGPNDRSLLHDIPLPEGDDWPGGKMRVPRSAPAKGQREGRPTAFTNVETHWWDASQIYGSGEDMIKRVRSEPGKESVLKDGKLWLDEAGLLPIDSQARINANDPATQELSGVNGNWWIGLSVLHTLFAREHNAIVDRLKIDHPAESGEWLFQKARLVNSALLAKIHTVEWTPALMDSPAGRLAMRGNYWGLMGERYAKTFGRASDSEVISGIPGSPQAHHGAPFAMTEEFAASYRLHSLLPDDFVFRSFKDDTVIQESDLAAVSGPHARGIYDKSSFDDVVYSLATEHPGALVLHNFPNALRMLNKKAEEGIFMDLAAIDILRDRERGIPRYQAFRRLIGAKAPKRFSDITSNRQWQRELKEIYGTVDKVDLLIGTLAEMNSKRGAPPRFGFSDTAFRVFILMASRRLKSDRFFTDDFRPEIYTRAGFDWVANNGFEDVIERHCPALAIAFGDTRNPFFPWTRQKR
ncbi:MAG: peroxidase [Rhodospirillaceae bacterium]|nr:peroxidase [Rhodospirillaceae bacterium]